MKKRLLYDKEKKDKYTSKPLVAKSRGVRDAPTPHLFPTAPASAGSEYTETL